MIPHPDPLVALWRQPARPLIWRPWLVLSAAELARLRCLLMEELRYLDACPGGPTWPWEHTHRELLAVKAATGRHTPEAV